MLKNKNSELSSAIIMFCGKGIFFSGPTDISKMLHIIFIPFNGETLVQQQCVCDISHHGIPDRAASLMFHASGRRTQEWEIITTIPAIVMSEVKFWYRSNNELLNFIGSF